MRIQNAKHRWNIKIATCSTGYGLPTSVSDHDNANQRRPNRVTQVDSKGGWHVQSRTDKQQISGGTKPSQDSQYANNATVLA